MKQDRFLVGILIAIGLLVVAAVALFFARRGSATYKPEDSPEAVVYNYVLALEKGDDERAYGYLAEGKGKPTFAEFRQFYAQEHSRNVGLQIHTTKITGEEAVVNVVVIHAGSGAFDSGWREDGLAILAKSGEGWKIHSMPYSFWAYDWYPKEDSQLPTNEFGG